MGNLDGVLQELLAEFRGARPAERLAVFRRATAVYADLAPTADAPLRERLQTLITYLAQFMDIEALAAFSEVLARMERPHGELLHLFAQGNYKVARPVLEHSSGIADEVLQSVARNGSVRSLISLARRRIVSARLAQLIVQRNDRLADVTLVDNPGATFFDRTVNILLELAEADPTLCEAMSDRADLSQECREKLATLSQLGVLKSLTHVLLPTPARPSSYIVPHQSTRLSALEELRMRIMAGR